ncbi:DNA replication/repair protein RecF [Nosocomiicoccus massiliensis]|uniref:DNA replication/repair protein RecF n=1 Tax=Nosocomiicoccus massiliensis TaxID=1232430 RepID=UPI000593020A|nr:DNA replication/repair protein RecF [Nosocomiicoccus massiliensis]
MKLSSIHLDNFRNYESLSLDFHDKLNVFIGKNAQGKTNLLESIYCLATTKSHRTTRDKEMIRMNQDEALISGYVENRFSEIPISLLLSKSGKRAKINHIELAKLSQYVGALNCVLFAPEDLEIVKGAPEVRRNFIDVECGQISKIYLQSLSDYKRVLKQKNLYLKERHVDKMMVEIFNEQLVEAALEIINKREAFVEALNEYAKQIHSDISNNKENLTVEYRPNIKCLELKKEERLQFLKETYESVIDNEIERRQCLIGPHRDDLKFYINDMDVQTYGSQGQQRSTALSLKLAELDVIANEIGEYPILLLDDVLSELDEHRQAHLLTSIRNRVQTFVTTTSISDINHQIMDEMNLYTIEEGTVKK